MALTGSFGMPEAARQQPVPEPRQYPQLHIMSVTVSDGGFERVEDIGAATRESELETYFDEWIALPQNKVFLKVSCVFGGCDFASRNSVFRNGFLVLSVAG